MTMVILIFQSKCSFFFDKRLDSKCSMAFFVKPQLSNFYANLTSLLNSSVFDLCLLSTSVLLTTLILNFTYWLAVEKNCWCFICPKLFDEFCSAQSCMKIILSNWWCVPINLSKNAKQAEKKTVSKRMNLKIKDHGNKKKR